MVAEINESVRKNEAERRIHVIEENLDFNNICEVNMVAERNNRGFFLFKSTTQPNPHIHPS